MRSQIFCLFFLVFLAQFVVLFGRSLPSPGRTLLQTTGNNPNSTCPLDFDILRRLAKGAKAPKLDTNSECQYIRQGLRLILSDYLRRTNFFLPPIEAADSCANGYQSLIREFSADVDIRRTCGFDTSWISQDCMGIITRSEFESNVSQTALRDVVSACNRSLVNSSPCASCTVSLTGLQASYVTRPSAGNVSRCSEYLSIYAGAFANQFGPGDKGTAECLFSLDFEKSNSGNKHKKIVIPVVVTICGLILVLGLFGFWYIRRKRKRNLRRTWKSQINSGLSSSALESIRANTNLIKFTLDEIKMSTNNFSRDNIIGRGGYGNVYKGVLPDGSEVALKRFKNCSAAGDASFTHEVEVIASIRHVNLVALRGYCVATTSFEGHQRIIVCDLIKNGSLYEHLFGTSENKLSWPIRQKIALGTAKGLAYLHYGAQPAIIHRDIKASNILIDENFEPKVADFGLAKFTPEGMTHLSTRVAGTMGYVAPEYALYGQLTERSDVYSFGVLLLELLSGKKAIMAVNDGQPTLVTDWAWSLVKKGRPLDVIEDNMPELGTPDVLEKYVLIAVLCSHPQLYARPTMEQVVKMLDTDIAVPSIPERPIPLTADLDDIHKSTSSSRLSTSSGYQLYSFGKEMQEEAIQEDARNSLDR
ncbi:hypothetical protein M9H77_01579 [Catharanthus roseus]|uniref:Uncharacterized protein n=1 Tax=Catharanthus roseus TaxID=4058 RepID=A0ACC0C668_CATRO|nr:hypothetical protein M9H77_01579 [Catharanthus roseus]